MRERIYTADNNGHTQSSRRLRIFTLLQADESSSKATEPIPFRYDLCILAAPLTCIISCTVADVFM